MNNLRENQMMTDLPEGFIASMEARDVAEGTEIPGVTPTLREYIELVAYWISTFLSQHWDRFIDDQPVDPQAEELSWARLDKIEEAIGWDEFYNAVVLACIRFRGVLLDTGFERAPYLWNLFLYSNPTQRRAVTATMQRFKGDNDSTARDKALIAIHSEVLRGLWKDADCSTDFPPELKKRMQLGCQCGK